MYKVKHVSGGRKAMKIVKREEFMTDEPKRKHVKRPVVEKQRKKRVRFAKNPIVDIEEFAMKKLHTKDKHRIEQQLREHFDNMLNSNMSGGSFIKHALSKVGSIINNVKDRVTGFFTGRDKLRPTARRVLEQHGNEEIRSIVVCREPVVSAVEKALNVISLGALNRAKQDLQYDRLFHLYMFITTDKGTSIIVQKNEVIDIRVARKEPNSKREEMSVPVTHKMTVNQLIENTAKLMGSNFLTYSSHQNNCQHFIDSVLTANHLNSPTLKKFVLQDTQELFKKMPSYLKPLSDAVTGLAGRIDVVKNGKGRKKRVGRGIFKPIPVPKMPTPKMKLSNTYNRW